MLTVPQTWTSVPVAPRMRTLVLDAEGKVSHQSKQPPRQVADGPIRLADEFVGPKLANGDKILTEPFAAIDSFDFSEARGEVAFSARRTAGFDIGLVSSDGSPISWVPNDPADELAVQWAPRGSKISYIVRTSGGDVVRTLHVPTAASLPVDFPGGTIHALAWDPPAERYAVAWSTVDASDRVEVLKYSGAERREVVSPGVRLDVEVEPLAPGAVLLRPRDLLYEEKLPLVVWSATDLQWSDARAALIRNARVAMVVATRPVGADFWRAVAATPWIDSQRTFIVGGACGADERCARATVINTDPAIPAGRYRRAANVVTVAPAVVQSFSAGFIADQLKRTSPTNGSSR
ncbi:MAG TPA: hypothetical protein VE010_23260 [Thermoanaerobaculia bacterium]|nr:hypothetical protein [Thermoanaerobaculia bacterium]